MRSELLWNPWDLCQLGWSFSLEQRIELSEILQNVKFWPQASLTFELRAVYFFIYLFLQGALEANFPLYEDSWVCAACLEYSGPLSGQNLLPALAGQMWLEQDPWWTQKRAGHSWQLSPALLWNSGSWGPGRLPAAAAMHFSLHTACAHVARGSWVCHAFLSAHCLWTHGWGISDSPGSP